MSENKDLAIKLFGKTIPLPFHNAASTRVSLTEKLGLDGHSSQRKFCSSGPSAPERNSATAQEGQQEQHEAHSEKEISRYAQDDDAVHQSIKDPKKPAATASVAGENPQAHFIDRRNSSLDMSKSGEPSEAGTSQEKILKKPDKILPCPRCRSMDTKFCYYNNYNVNQPRHFCKNCQRYWTAGGTMRNVPVGSGRRKNKNAAASHYRRLMVPQISPTAQLDVANGFRNGLLGTNPTVLTFGSDAPLCDSLSSVLNLADKTNSIVRNCFHQPEQRAFVSCLGEDDGEDRSAEASITAGSTGRKGDYGLQDSVGTSYQPFPAQVPCIPAPWPYALNSTQWSPAVPPFPPTFPVSFYSPPPYWGCALPSSWNVQFSSPSSSLNQRTSVNSPKLGKHSRDGDILATSNFKKEENDEVGGSEETSVLVPQTLRIDDPTESAKSSIWEALGIKNEKALFNGFQPDRKGENHVVEPSALLQANPAAFSRSLDFHETS